MSNDKLPVSVDNHGYSAYEQDWDECGYPVDKALCNPSLFSVKATNRGFKAGRFEAKVLRDVFRIQADQIGMILNGINCGDDIHLRPSTRDIAETRVQKIEDMRRNEGIRRPNVFEVVKLNPSYQNNHL